MKSISQVVTFALLAFASQASAGVGPEYLFAPVNTPKQAATLKAGSTVAISCSKCGMIHTTKIDKERSYLQSVTCPGCQTKYVVSSGGRAGGMTRFVYTDDAKHEAHLYSKTN